MDREHKVTVDGASWGLMRSPSWWPCIYTDWVRRTRKASRSARTACWIWDRVPVIVKQAGLENVPVHQVLDNCHATHHISLALAALGLSDCERLPLYREHRSKLRNGQWRKVVSDLESLAADAPEKSKVHAEIAYLRKHGEAKRMNYVPFVKDGIPRGSGAIESSIRRVINMRLKNNATFWREENAESMLQLRANVISKRWDETQSEIGKLARKDARTDWQWEPRPMSCKEDANLTTGI
ncbi:MAG: hypothetical protein KDB14_23965 [Planctomycetales bacterium]|nr:hypothetical protein [Planctomycetales bacterium]